MEAETTRKVDGAFGGLQAKRMQIVRDNHEGVEEDDPLFYLSEVEKNQ
jgi:hypothetical protein